MFANPLFILKTEALDNSLESLCVCKWGVGWACCMVSVIMGWLGDLFIYLFLAVLGLRCCTWAFSSCGELGLLFVVVCRLLIAVASLVVEHGL